MWCEVELPGLGGERGGRRGKQKGASANGGGGLGGF